MGQRLRSKRGTDRQRDGLGVGGWMWGDTDTERRREAEMEREVRKGGSESSHFSSSEHPFLHIIISALLSCITPLTLRKIDCLITTTCKSACLPMHWCVFVQKCGWWRGCICVCIFLCFTLTCMYTFVSVGGWMVALPLPPTHSLYLLSQLRS